jgi:hypothetical protein
MDSQLAVPALQLDRALRHADRVWDHHLHKRRRHHFVGHRAGYHAPFQLAAIQVQRGGCLANAISPGHLGGR